jgi:hypothetical protein
MNSLKPDTRTGRLLIACLLGGTLLGASLPGAAAKTLKLQGAEGQRGSNLCWAASSVTAIRMLRTPQELDADDDVVTQDQLAAYRMLVRVDGELGDSLEVPTNLAKLERLTSRQIEAIPSDRLQARLADCKAAIGPCDESNPPILLDMHFDSTEPGKALNWSNIVEQIDSGRPVVFGWNTEDLAAGREFGPHFSLVTGYRVRQDVREVRLWDPWPASATGQGGQHSRWISYCTYRNPRNVMGSEATHQFDRYNLTRITAQGPAQPRRSSPQSITADDDCQAGADGPGSAGEDIPPDSLRAVHDAFRDEERIRETLDGRAIPRRALFKRFAAGLPIVSVSARQIVRAEGDAGTLLVDSANSVLIPVTRGRSTVDSFLVLRDGRRGWTPGGYANTAAAALLVAERRRQSGGDFYMVSVPSMNAYFLAQGVGSQASLIPIWNDAAIGARAGEARPADFFFSRFREVLRERGSAPG